MTEFKNIIKSQEEFATYVRTFRSFYNTHFKCNISLKEIQRIGAAPDDFNNCLFDGSVDFSNQGFQKASFENSSFKSTANFSNSVFEQQANFKNVQFTGEVNFEGSKFKGKTRFHSSGFRDVISFDNVRFEELADFYKTHFYKNQVFFKTDFLKTTVFSRASFDGNVYFTYSSISGMMIFRHAKFKAGFDISLANIDGSLNFFNLSIKNFLTVPTPKTEDEYDAMVADGENIPVINKRETFRIIKDQLTKQNSKIDAMLFHKFEMDSYQEELNYRKNIDGNKYRNDRIINFWNKYSNEHGLSWIKGLRFTVVAAALSFSISMLFLDKYPYTIGSGNTLDALAWVLKYFFELLLPTHQIEILDRYSPCFMFYIVDFAGRIFISYGIYQTISAFRKYNKK